MRRLFLLIYALSGCAALIYEVIWTRLLTLHMGHTVAAVSTVLAAFLGGMAGGALAGGMMASRRTPRDAIRLYVWLELAIAASALAVPVLLAGSKPLLAAAYAGGAGGARFALIRIATSLIVLGVPAAAMGATFPIAARWMVDDLSRAGAAAGGLYAANTVGAAFGAAAAAFLLMPALGLRVSALTAAGLNVVAAAVALFIAARLPAAAALPPAGPAEEPIRLVASAFRACEFILLVASAFRRKITRRRNFRLKAEARRPIIHRLFRRKSRRAGGLPAQAGSHGRSADRATRAKSAHRAIADGRPALACFALAITGFVALVNEVAWTRVLSLIVGPTTYAFGAMLSVFIAGLAAGSAVAARFADRVRHPPLALALVMVAVAAAPAAVMSTVEPWSMRVARVVASAGAGFGDLLRIQALSAAALLLPLTFALGAAFPLALRVAVRARDAVSHDVAIVYAANTAGAIAGSLIGGFVLVPNFGLQRTLLLTCIIALCGAVVLTMASRMPRRAAFGGMFAAIAGGSLIWAAPSWDMDLLASGAYKYAPYMQGADVASVLRAGTTLYFREGAAATVAVRRVAGTTTLSIEGKVDASNGGDMLTQKLLAHLPLLLHEHPRRVAIIGLGSGVTLGAALTHPIERADAIEISPEVVHASHFFDVENHRALADPRARLIVGDGRSHVMLTRERYDVIISEPSNPWMAGIAALFTREFFQAVRRSLQEDGIFCQWAHTYDISDADLRSIAATFISVYPDATMWLIGEADLLFVASPTGLTDRLNGIRGAFNRWGVAGDLREAAVLDPESILATFVAGPAELAAYSAGAVVQTDDRLALEFSAPRSIVGRRDPNNAAVIRGLATEHSLPQPVREARASSSSDAWRNRGQMLLQAEAYSTAYDAYARALALAPVDESVLGGFVKAAAGARRDRDAERVLAAVVDNHPNDVAPRIQLSRLLASRGEIEHAINAIAPLMTSRPDDPRAFEQAASIFADVGDASRLREVVDHLQRAWPLKSSSRYYAAALALQDGRATDALRLAELAIAGESPEARAYNLKGAAAATLGQRDEARRAFEEALRRDPHDATAYVNLGLIELESGRTAAASRHFAEALIVDPDSRAAREGLAGVADRR